MKYRVIGVRRSSGQEVDQTVDCITAANAAVMAQQAGVVVTGVFDEMGTSCPFPLLPIAAEPVAAPVPAETQKWNPAIAALCSFLLPGLGQIYKGQVFNGILWFFMTCIGYMFFIIPGMFFHFFCVVGAVSGDPTKRG